MCHSNRSLQILIISFIFPTHLHGYEKTIYDVPFDVH